MLYAIVDPEQTPGGDVVALAAQVLSGGASWLQLRAKNLPDDVLLSTAKALAGLARGRARFFINDRADIAALCGADGVHVGQTDLTVPDARSALHAGQHVGVSTHHAAQVARAVADGGDVLGFGPVFPSATKTGHAPVTGIEGLRAAVLAAGGTPVIAIGGIGAHNAAACAAAGAHAVAVIGALAQAADPRAAARAILAAFNSGRRVGAP